MTVKMLKLLVLTSALAVLGRAAVLKPAEDKVSPIDVLDKISDLIGKYHNTFSKEKKADVEDVSPLAEGGDKCQEIFFCTVHDILTNRSHEKKTEEKEVARNLSAFIKMSEFRCEEALMDMKPAGVKIQVVKLMDLLIHCTRHRKMNGTTSKPQTVTGQQ